MDPAMFKFLRIPGIFMHSFCQMRKTLNGNFRKRKEILLNIPYSEKNFNFGFNFKINVHIYFRAIEMKMLKEI